MKKCMRLFPLLVTLLVASSLGVVGWAADKGKPEVLPFDAIDFFFEFNSTDEDLGVQLCLGGDPWKRLKIYAPDGKKILDVECKDSLKEFGLSSFFFESNEPTFDEVSEEDILGLFPEGEYEFVATTIEGDILEGTAELTHDIPGAPVILTPADGDVVDPDDVVVTWSKVTTPAGIKIQSYQVIVTNDEDSAFTYDVRVPADVTSLSVPSEFFAPDTEYELEILAVEESGNQTIALIFFTTE